MTFNTQYRTISQWDSILEGSDWLRADREVLNSPSKTMTHYGWRISIINEHPFRDRPDFDKEYTPHDWFKEISDWLEITIPSGKFPNKFEFQNDGSLYVLNWIPIIDECKPNSPDPWDRLSRIRNEIATLDENSPRLKSLRVEEEMMAYIVYRKENS